MFKKLKEKITEEVKISPQRFQQLTQSVSDRLNSTTSDENFFSIGDDDANTSNASLEPGFTSVSLTSPQEPRFRRNSNSSMASDVSFLPRYESVANMYHLQSDLDASASEMEDNASSSSQLGHLSKEQIYLAFQKSQMRYHKYRGRYTDLARHYKDLERENGKMKAVLVETQDKAIRRIAELKEQCALEQKAKAHLEGALRDEMDEKQLKIQSLQTKIELLRNGGTTQDGDTLDALNKYLTDARQEIETLNERIQEMKANSIIFQTKESEYKSKIAGLEKELATLSEREKENSLSLAQNKMELHNELLNKDVEINGLKQEIDALRKNQDAGANSTKLENLQAQNKKLIEKIESLTEKYNNYESELLKIEQTKIELQNANQTNLELTKRVKEADEKLETVRDETKKSILSLERKIKEKLEKEFEHKEQEMKGEFQRKLEQVSNDKDLHDVQMSLLVREEELESLKKDNERMSEAVKSRSEKYVELERNHLELIEESSVLRSKIAGLEKELAAVENTHQAQSLKLTELENKLKTLVRENESLQRTTQEEKETAKNEYDEEMKKLLDDLGTKTNTIASLESKLLATEEETKELNIQREDLQKQEEVNRQLNREVEQLRTKMINCDAHLEEKKKEFEFKIEEEKQKLLQELNKQREDLQKQEEVNRHLNQEVEQLRTSILHRDAHLEEKKKEFEFKIKEEKLKLLEKVEASENMVKKLEETSMVLSEELNTLKEQNEEISELHSQLQNAELEKRQLVDNLARNEEQLKRLTADNSAITQELKRLRVVTEENDNLRSTIDTNKEAMRRSEETNHVLSTKVDNLEKEVRDLLSSLESERAINSLLKANENKASDLEDTNCRLNQDLRTKEETVVMLETTIDDLNLRMRSKDEEVRSFKEKLEAEIRLLKTQLEEANTDCKKLKTLEERYLTSKEENDKLVSKIHTFEDDMEVKNAQVEALSRKLEEYNELIEERNEGFFKLLHNVSLDLHPPNNFTTNKDNKNLLNLEEKLQNFEQTFSLEKENLKKILSFLKQFDLTHSSVVEERNQLETEKQELLLKIDANAVAVKQFEEQFVQLKAENADLMESVEKMKRNASELEARNVQIVSDSNFLSDENQSLITELEELKLSKQQIETTYAESQSTINKLEASLSETTPTQLAELERHVSDLLHENQLLKEEIQELKTAPINDDTKYLNEIEHLRTKVVQYKSLDLTNRSSIEFYENELQKLKNQNEKLNRKLDETLVTLNHCAELSNSTEVEYLKNVLYNYMLGKESMVLARVIAAVCKFDPHQTEMILAKEQQKQTLLGHLGIL